MRAIAASGGMRRYVRGTRSGSLFTLPFLLPRRGEGGRRGEEVKSHETRELNISEYRATRREGARARRSGRKAIDMILRRGCGIGGGQREAGGEGGERESEGIAVYDKQRDR